MKFLLLAAALGACPAAAAETAAKPDLAKAQASGNSAQVAQAQAALDARREWLAQAQAGLKEFGPRP